MNDLEVSFEIDGNKVKFAFGTHYDLSGQNSYERRALEDNTKDFREQEILEAKQKIKDILQDLLFKKR